MNANPPNRSSPLSRTFANACHSNRHQPQTGCERSEHTCPLSSPAGTRSVGTVMYASPLRKASISYRASTMIVRHKD
eukprot:755479-Hanusia_phi.AAC.4